MPLPHPCWTEVCEDRDFVEWHQGRPWCAVWVLRMEQAEVIDWVQKARASVAPWLLPRYARQPHITLAYRGLMAAANSVAAAEFGPQQLQADIRVLQSAHLQPWLLRLQGSGSFSTVPYVGVELSEPLEQTHAVLSAAAPYPGWQYVPHITLGHYGSVQPMEHMVQCLQASVPKNKVLAATWVQSLWLARYRSDDIAGALYYEGRFDLQTQQYLAQPGALLPG